MEKSSKLSAFHSSVSAFSPSGDTEAFKVASSQPGSTGKLRIDTTEISPISISLWFGYIREVSVV